MERRMTVADYLGTPETTRPQELAYGILRELDAPGYGHQAVVTHMAALLDRFVRRTKLGAVCASPVDVVFDRRCALVLQPDLIFVSAARLGIIRERVWGAPDLVVEVLSPRTANRDRTRKFGWYRQYGTREGWLVDPRAREVTVVRLDREDGPAGRIYRGSQRLYSRVLPGFRPSVGHLLG
jgi:Uma2 family endonuclease